MSAQQVGGVAPAQSVDAQQQGDGRDDRRAKRARGRAVWELGSRPMPAVASQLVEPELGDLRFDLR